MGRLAKHATWVGPLVVFGGAVSYFLVFARFPSLRDVPWVNLPLVLAGLAASLWALAGFGGFRWPRKLAATAGLVFSLALAALFCWYVFDLSYRLPAAAEAPAVGAEAPQFALPDQHGTPVRLAELRGRPVVLVFYRGHW